MSYDTWKETGFDWGLDDEFDEDDDFEFDCGLDQHGQCPVAGSEDCDFECPWNQPPFRYGRLERKKKSLPLFPEADEKEKAHGV